MSPFSNNYFIGYPVENDILIIIGSPKISYEKPTIKEHIQSFVKYLAPAQGRVVVRLSQIPAPINIDVDVNSPQFDRTRYPDIYNTEREANNALIRIRADANWDLREYNLTVDNYSFFDKLKIYRTDDTLPELIKNTRFK
mgnify:FL=1